MFGKVEGLKKYSNKSLIKIYWKSERTILFIKLGL